MMLDDDAELECKDRTVSADGPFVQYPTYITGQYINAFSHHSGCTVYTSAFSPALLSSFVYLREGFYVCIAIGVLHCNCSA